MFTYQYCGKCVVLTTSCESSTWIKESILIRRSVLFPLFDYTCLAAFIKPDESIPETCSHEVSEESRVVVDTNTTCISDSQSLPFRGG